MDDLHEIEYLGVFRSFKTLNFWSSERDTRLFQLICGVDLILPRDSRRLGRMNCRSCVAEQLKNDKI